MKQFTAFFLTIVLCFLCLVPVSARAAEFQATYTSNLPFEDYDYFIIFYDNSNSSYWLYILNSYGENSVDGVQFYVTSSPSTSYLAVTSGATQFYRGNSYKFDDSEFFVQNGSVTSGGTKSNFNFHGTDTGRGILSSNCDIYDQNNYKIRSGDYENFLSYFTNPEQVQHVVNNYVPEPTTEAATTGEGSGESGGLINIDFSGITSTFTNLITPIQLKLADIYNILVDIKQIVNERIYLKIIHINELQREVEKVTDKLDDIVTTLGSTDIVDKLDSVSDDITDELSDITTALSGFSTNFQTFCTTFNGSFTDKIESIKDTLTVISVRFTTFCNGWASKLDNISYDIISKLNSIQSGELTAISNKLNGLSSGFQSVVTAVNGIPSSIQDILEYLFIPQNNNYFQDIIDTINSKFGFINQFIELGDVLVNNSESFTNTPPNFTIEFEDNDIFGDLSFDLIDWSKISDYVSYVKVLTGGITLYLFIRRTRKRLPEIISGGGC